MENKDKNIDYQKFVRVGDQKWEIVEITIRIIFFCLGFAFSIFYTRSFQVPPEKNHPHLKCRKCQFPPKISIWLKSLLYKYSEKWLRLTPSHSITHGGVGLQTMTSLPIVKAFSQTKATCFHLHSTIFRWFFWFSPLSGPLAQSKFWTLFHIATILRSCCTIMTVMIFIFLENGI